MSERGKSLLLITLVLLSLLLTYQLWFGQTPLEEMTEDAYEPIFFEEPRPLSRVVTPGWIQLHQGEEIYQFGYGASSYHTLWNWLSEVMLSEVMQMIPFAEFRLVEEKPGIGLPLLSLSFRPPLPTGQGSPWLKEGVQREVEEVILMREGDYYWMELKTTGGAKVQLDISPDHGLSLQELVSSLSLDDAVPYRELNSSGLSAALGTEILVSEPLFVPAGPVQMEELVFKEEELDQELLVKTFFVDRSLVRVIAERDGSLIYTDGEKGFRLSGGLVFSHPQLDQRPATYTYTASLHSASRLLGYYGGWPEHLRLESLKRRGKAGSIQDSVLTCWRSYYHGRPVFGDTGVIMVFNDSGMVEYKRHLYEAAYPVGAPFIVQGYQEALLTVLALLNEQSSVLEPGAPLVLEEMVLGYMPDPASVQPRGIPVWAIRINGIDLLINAKDLTWLEGVTP